jgi:DNA-binding CsgD family transcriptional regulator
VAEAATTGELLGAVLEASIALVRADTAVVTEVSVAVIQHRVVVAQGSVIVTGGLHIYDELMPGLGFDHQVALSIPIDRDRRICVTINRHGRDFSKAEVDRLEALRRPVAACASHIALMERLDLPGASATARLTPRERDVLTLVATGLSNVQIGLRLGISARTVNKHLEHIFTKTGLSNRTQVAACWPRMGRQRWEPAGPET